MRQRGLVPITLFTVITTGFLLNTAGWFDRRIPSPAAAAEVRRGEAITSAAAARYRQGQPTHWRALVMHR